MSALPKYTPEYDDDLEPQGLGAMGLLEHLDELRKRIIVALSAVAVGALLGFTVGDRMFEFVMQPLRKALPPNAVMIYTEPTEGFSVYLQVVLLTGILLASPVVLWQVWAFIAPGLYGREKRIVVPFVVSATCCFVGGAAFSHYIAFPAAVTFLASFSNDYILFRPRLGPNFALYIRMVLMFGIVFQMPTLTMFLSRLGLVTARWLIRHVKYAVLLIFIVAAVATPTTDPSGQVILAVPMLVLYAISIVVAWVCAPRALMTRVAPAIAPVIATALAVASAVAVLSSRLGAADAVPPDEEIRRILVERIDVAHQGVGIVVGVIEPSGSRVVGYGTFTKDDKRAVKGDTVFEIGSITKVFTSLLLADMVRRREVELTDRVARYIPYQMNVPERNGRAITLLDLATHTSGLPRMPSNFVPKNPANPYADYDSELLRQFLSGYGLSRDIGSQYEYSNIGAGILGYALSRRAGMDYDTFLRDRITGPRLLDMPDTRVVPTDSMTARLATGHNALRTPVASWEFPPTTSIFVGAGGLRSTVNDLLKFLAAMIGLTKTPLSPAMAAMLANPRPTGRPNQTIGLAWHIDARGDRQIVQHNGGTGGYRSFIGFDPKSQIGVVVLSNTNTQTGVDDIGMHLLDTSFPLAVTRVTPPATPQQPPR